MRRAENGLNMVSKNPKGPLNRHSFAFVSGLGFGWMSGFVSYITLLTEALGPGILTCISCPLVSLYFISAITTVLFTLLHITWMMLTFEGLAGSKSAYLFVWVVVTHFGASYGTLLNSSNISYGCVYSILLALILLIINTILVIRNLHKISAQH
ncbi:Aph-1 [Basidiobolus meristosporus CBS 931.73]|uniref:Aph-1 n=1 Tax=Basidiobolus meristosporus CBS 931.73 TaxID=1314790 RepID=A0A1Y1XR08_9FUNG|nr:Aph-1 [Basidiobolus meristosporus CBS 931.73]|eukprot:ORX88167.1 Aph-1 [Basidiobolus meristosporus CBS 931.73]